MLEPGCRHDGVGRHILVTTLPAPMTAPSPIVTPFKIIAFAPIHAPFDIVIGLPECCAPSHVAARFPLLQISFP